MFDDLGPLPDFIDVPELGIFGGYHEAAAQLLTSLWVPRADVRKKIDSSIQALALPSSFLAMHVRRGDKIHEASYVAVEKYIAAARLVGRRDEVLFIATDDSQVVEEIARGLPKAWRIVTAARAEAQGHSERGFNAMSSPKRFGATLELLVDLELLHSARAAIVTPSSNVGLLVRYRRAGKGVLML